MTEFTKDHPFKSSHGYSVYRVFDDIVTQVRNHEPRGHERTHAEAIAEMLEAEHEAESAVWRWVEDGKVARKGRRTLTIAGGGVSVVHDDFRDGPDDKGAGMVYPIDEARYIAERGHSNEYAYWNCVAVVSFLAWLAAQSQPTEPSTFGYVGTVTDGGGGVRDVFRHEGRGVACYSSVAHRSGRMIFDANWREVLALGTFEPKGER